MNIKGIYTSGVTAENAIGRLDGCSCYSGELGTSSSGELDGDIVRCVKKKQFGRALMELMVQGHSLMEIRAEDPSFL